jgi:hypothetical protein
MTTVATYQVRASKPAIWAVILLIALLFVAIVVWGWPLQDEISSGPLTLTESGNEFSVSFTPSNGNLSIYRAELPITELRPVDVVVRTITYPVEGPTDSEVAWTGQSFSVSGPLDNVSSLDIEVQDVKTLERELFHFSLGEAK